jgi:hypothetical protein
MRKLLLASLLLTGIGTFQSCTKERTDKHRGDQVIEQTLNVSLRANEAYQYELGSFTSVEAAQAAVSRQPSHYLVSSIERDHATGKVNYNYTPAAGYTGADELQLRIVQAGGNTGGYGGMCGNGGGGYNTQRIITIKINVSN